MITTKLFIPDYRLAKISELRSISEDIRNASDIESRFRTLKRLEDLQDDDLIKNLSCNDIRLGTTPAEEPCVPEGTLVTIPSRSLNGNISISARIRTGKTFLVMNMLRQLSRLGIKWLVFERKKSFRQLVNDTKAIIVTPEELKHNLFRPPKGVPFRSHLMKICSVFAGTQLLTQVSEHVLYEVVMGNQPEFQKEHPGKFMDAFQLRILLAELLKKLGYKEPRKRNFVDGNADRWDAICTYFAEMCSELEGVELYDLFQKANVIVDCSELSNAMTAFLFFEILTVLTLSRLCNCLTERNAPLHVTAADEFESTISQVSITGHSLLLDHWSMDRESNLGKIVVNHTADYHQRYDNQIVTNTISANTYYHVLGPMSNNDELLKIGRRLSFEPRHYEWLTRNGERHFVLTSPSHPPICFVADEVEFPQTINEQEHAQRKHTLLSKYESDPVPVARKEFALSEVFRKEFSMPRTMDQVRVAAQSNLRSAAIRFLQLVKENPFSSYAEIRTKFNSVATAQKVKSFCLDSDWVKEASIGEGKNRPSLFFHITEVGRSVLKDEGIVKTNDRFHPIKHNTWIAKCVLIVAERMAEIGFHYELDKGDGVDLTIKDTSDLVICGIEFNYTASVAHELKLIQKCLGLLPRVLLVVVDFTEEKKNSYRMSVPEGKIVAFNGELETTYESISSRVTILTWEDMLKWKP